MLTSCCEIFRWGMDTKGVLDSLHCRRSDGSILFIKINQRFPAGHRKMLITGVQLFHTPVSYRSVWSCTGLALLLTSPRAHHAPKPGMSPGFSPRAEDIRRGYRVNGAGCLLPGQELWFPWFRRVCSLSEPIMQVCHVRTRAPGGAGGAWPYVTRWNFSLCSRWSITLIRVFCWEMEVTFMIMFTCFLFTGLLISQRDIGEAVSGKNERTLNGKIEDLCLYK